MDLCDGTCMSSTSFWGLRLAHSSKIRFISFWPDLQKSRSRHCHTYLCKSSPSSLSRICTNCLMDTKPFLHQEILWNTHVGVFGSAPATCTLHLINETHHLNETHQTDKKRFEKVDTTPSYCMLFTLMQNIIYPFKHASFYPYICALIVLSWSWLHHLK